MNIYCKLSCFALGLVFALLNTTNTNAFFFNRNDNSYEEVTITRIISGSDVEIFGTTTNKRYVMRGRTKNYADVAAVIESRAIRSCNLAEDKVFMVKTMDSVTRAKFDMNLRQYLLSTQNIGDSIPTQEDEIESYTKIDELANKVTPLYQQFLKENYDTSFASILATNRLDTDRFERYSRAFAAKYLTEFTKEEIDSIFSSVQPVALDILSEDVPIAPSGMVLEIEGCYTYPLYAKPTF